MRNQNERVLVLDPHCHTNIADGFCTPEEVVQQQVKSYTRLYAQLEQNQQPELVVGCTEHFEAIRANDRVGSQHNLVNRKLYPVSMYAGIELVTHMGGNPFELIVAKEGKWEELSQFSHVIQSQLVDPQITKNPRLGFNPHKVNYWYPDIDRVMKFLDYYHAYGIVVHPSANGPGVSSLHIDEFDNLRKEIGPRAPIAVEGHNGMLNKLQIKRGAYEEHVVGAAEAANYAITAGSDAHLRDTFTTHTRVTIDKEYPTIAEVFKLGNNERVETVVDTSMLFGSRGWAVYMIQMGIHAGLVSAWLRGYELGR